MHIEFSKREIERDGERARERRGKVKERKTSKKAWEERDRIERMKRNGGWKKEIRKSRKVKRKEERQSKSKRTT